MNGLDQLQGLLNVLAVKDWCSVEELAAVAGWKVDRTRSIIEFLTEHGMVFYRASDSMVRLEPQLRQLVVEED